jgi:hypothetical protein
VLKNGVKMKNTTFGFQILVVSFLAFGVFLAHLNAQPLGKPQQTVDTGQIYWLGSQRFVYEKPDALDFIKFFPGNLWTYTRQTLCKDNLVNIGLMASATALLVAYDQDILNETQRFGRRIGLTGNNRLKPVFKIFGFPIELPHDTDTALYFIGDGWTHTLISGIFMGYGLITNDNRALQTASQIASGMFSTGLSTQLLKHITGRESPFKATVPGGRWRLFPNQIDYHKNVPAYDAYPSGHLATATMTYTVIASNYPGSKIVKPLGITLLTLLSFEMVNNGVHWISDYPLAIAMGYSLGKIAVARGRKELSAGESLGAVQNIHPVISPYFFANGLGVSVEF